MPKKDLAPCKGAAQRNPISQPLSKNLIHLTFSTKDREASPGPANREGLHLYVYDGYPEGPRLAPL
ncbi:hypothetical protein SBV1_310021 [Verrucomicrobia bacterium]|nr:hypothetical protein SBV1_310021 [Verrucomicrobiota bacterium]